MQVELNEDELTMLQVALTYANDCHEESGTVWDSGLEASRADMLLSKLETIDDAISEEGEDGSLR